MFAETTTHQEVRWHHNCYCFHRQWGFPYSVVLCGNLTIPNYEKYFHCFLFVSKAKLRHSPGRPSRSDFVQPEFIVPNCPVILFMFILCKKDTCLCKHTSFPLSIYNCVRFRNLLPAPRNYIYISKSQVSSYSVHSSVPSCLYFHLFQNINRGFYHFRTNILKKTILPGIEHPLFGGYVTAKHLPADI